MTTALAEGFLAEGFLSQSEPLIVMKLAGVATDVPPWVRLVHDDTVPEGVLQQPEGELQAWPMGYVKGQARLSVLQALLSICIEDGQLLEQV